MTLMRHPPIVILHEKSVIAAHFAFLCLLILHPGPEFENPWQPSRVELRATLPMAALLLFLVHQVERRLTLGAMPRGPA